MGLSCEIQYSNILGGRKQIAAACLLKTRQPLEIDKETADLIKTQSFERQLLEIDKETADLRKKQSFERQLLEIDK